MLDLLIELGADVETKDDKGRTPLAMAMLRGDEEAIRLLRAAGAKEPPVAFFTDRAQELYDVLKARQLRAAGRASNAADGEVDVPFEEDLYTPFYGGRQFSIRDINGLALIFWQPEWLAPIGESRVL
jgi:ankyrin repeat protein